MHKKLGSIALFTYLITTSLLAWSTCYKNSCKKEAVPIVLSKKDAKLQEDVCQSPRCQIDDPELCQPITVSYVVDPYNKLQINGKIDVDLHTGYSTPKVILYGDPRDLSHMKMRSRQGSFYLSMEDGYKQHGQVKAVVRAKLLNYFGYRGDGTIRSSHLKSSMLELAIQNRGETRISGNYALNKLWVGGNGSSQFSGISGERLDVYMAGNPNVKLRGVINLATLQAKGNGRLGLYWVKSSGLTVRAEDSSHLSLAGIVNKFDVELKGQAKLNARYLRANHTFIKTRDKSVAQINSVDRQHTLALDASDIYFYHLSPIKTDFMAYDGSVLDMRRWKQIAENDYTVYNK